MKRTAIFWAGAVMSVTGVTLGVIPQSVNGGPMSGQLTCGSAWNSDLSRVSGGGLAQCESSLQTMLLLSIAAAVVGVALLVVSGLMAKRS